MIIGIDANALTRPFQHGIRRYLEDLIKGISKIDNKNTYILFSSKNIRIPNKSNFRLVIIPKIPVLKRQLFLPLAVIKSKVDVFHNIDPYGSVLLRKPSMVTTVHDINLEDMYPTFHNVKYFSKYIYSRVLRFFVFRNTDHFISVSNTTLKELNEYVKKYRFKGSKNVIYESVSNKFKYNLANTNVKKYFLCMADFSPRKNFQNVLKSFSKFQGLTFNKYRLYVIISTKEESIRISKIIEDNNLRKFVKVFVSPTDKTVKNLFKFATAFIYVSLYEGFGLPILEAMSIGCPVITSNFGAMKEVAGGAALMVDPRSTQSIVKAMLEFAKDKVLRNKMLKKGIRRASEFSTQNMATKTVKIYENAFNKKNMKSNNEPNRSKARYFVIFLTLLVIVAATIISVIKSSAWTSFVAHGKVSMNILKYNDKLIFGTSNSKVYFLRNNANYQTYDLNTGSVNWLKIRGKNVLTMSDDTIRSIRIRDQKLNWKVSTVNQTVFVKADIVNGVLLTGSADGTLAAYRINDGSKIWDFQSKQIDNLSKIYADYNLHYFGKFLVDRGVIYFASQDQYLYAIRFKNGEVLWENHIGELITSSPVVSKKNLNVGTVSGRSININLKNGVTNWDLRGAENLICEVVSNKSFLFGNSILIELYADGTLISRKISTGDVLWQLQELGSMNQCPIIWKSKAITVSTNGELSLVFLKSGIVEYTRSGLGEIVNPPIIQPKFKGLIPKIINFFSPGVLLGNTDGILYKIDAFSGKDIWNFSVGVPSANAYNLIGNDVYFSTTNGVIYKINSQTGIPKISSRDRAFSISQQTKKVSDVNIVELTLESSTVFENPWVQTDIYAIFIDENGVEYKVPGFYYDQGLWKVRFNPPKKGEWSWKVYWLPHGKLLTKSGKFASTTDTSNYYLRISKDNTRRLTLDNKTIFNGLGLGDAMDDFNSNGTPYDDWAIGNSQLITREDASMVAKSEIINTLDTYLSTYGPKGAGFNLFRWSLMNASQAQYMSIDSPQTYSILQGKIGDQLVEKLRENNIHIWLTMFGFDIPYKYDNSPGSVNLLRSYIKYLFARYGAYVDVWELANELSVPYTTSNTMINEIRNIDFEHRPISVSSTGYNFEESDIIAPHWYETESISESDTKTSNQINKYSGYNKPVVFAEQGNSSINYDITSGVRMRVRSWTSFFEEGILMFWNQSDSKNYTASIFPANLFIGDEERKYMSVLQDLTSSFPLNSRKVNLDLSTYGVRGYGLLSDKINGYYFFHYLSPTTTTSIPLTVNTEFGGKVSWVDPSSGRTTQGINCPPGVCYLVSPAFDTDMALFIGVN